MTEQEANGIIEDLLGIGDFRISKRINAIERELAIKRVIEMDRMVVKLENCYLNSDGEPVIKCGTPFFSTILVPEFIGYETSRLGKMFLWLKNNYKPYQNRFPQMPSFKQAQRETTNNKLADTSVDYKNKYHHREDIEDALNDVRDMIASNWDINVVERVKAKVPESDRFWR